MKKPFVRESTNAIFDKDLMEFQKAFDKGMGERVDVALTIYKAQKEQENE